MFMTTPPLDSRHAVMVRCWPPASPRGCASMAGLASGTRGSCLPCPRRHWTPVHGAMAVKAARGGSEELVLRTDGSGPGHAPLQLGRHRGGLAQRRLVRRGGGIEFMQQAALAQGVVEA